MGHLLAPRFNPQAGGSLGGQRVIIFEGVEMQRGRISTSAVRSGHHFRETLWVSEESPV